MREHGGLELFSGLGEQSLVARFGERSEEIPRPFPRFPGECFTARLQDELIAALAAHSGCVVDLLQQLIWNMERRGWHE